MPLPSLRLTKAQLDDLWAVCDIGPGKLTAAANSVCAAKPTIKRATIQALIAETVGEASSKGLCRVLFGLAATSRRYFVSSSQIVDSVSNALSNAEWSKERLQTWADRQSAIIDMLDSEVIFLTAKAIDLTFDFAQMFVSARILTGTRPVINQDRTVIIGSVLTQTLRLDYVTPAGDQISLTVAMDKSDILRLQEACDDALRKAALTKSLIENGQAKEAVIPGEETDE